MQEPKKNPCLHAIPHPPLENKKQLQFISSYSFRCEQNHPQPTVAPTHCYLYVSIPRLGRFHWHLRPSPTTQRCFALPLLVRMCRDESPEVKTVSELNAVTSDGLCQYSQMIGSFFFLL